MIENAEIFEMLIDTLMDCAHLVPLLFVIFVLIEIVEYFYVDKINELVMRNQKTSLLAGSLLALIPQCGFSVIASVLYLKRYITKGTLIAIYLATSDEAIPILLAQPESFHYVVPVIALKLAVALLAGVLVDKIFPAKPAPAPTVEIEHETGCCKHTIGQKELLELVIHPIKHTLNIFLFIFLVSLALNLLIAFCLKHALLHSIVAHLKPVAPLFTGTLGLVPSCAVSVGLTTLLVDGALKFSAVTAGLLSNAGLGILVLLKQNDNKKDTLLIVGILCAVSVVAGFILQIFGV